MYFRTYKKVKKAFRKAGYKCKGEHEARGYTGTPFSTGRENLGDYGQDCAPIIKGHESSCDHNFYPFHSALCRCVLKFPALHGHEKQEL